MVMELLYGTKMMARLLKRVNVSNSAESLEMLKHLNEVFPQGKMIMALDNGIIRVGVLKNEHFDEYAFTIDDFIREKNMTPELFAVRREIADNMNRKDMNYAEFKSAVDDMVAYFVRKTIEREW